ncbi:Uncharacterized conserved protein [Amycolatopsis arida]|uniref:Uncharacterized conserved protein n=1 Tax=Amycolatopsis arida TaxID=587909 RepID=A0A1I5TSA2_9PSEU|nr:YciI family protein [Amycolatopsis arida]TDX95992.1 hypothetical protein CLV69_103127 [Amycolatopsis arida]SFP85791.1 Uncharacterized conserved protein [Amycolatopsis arida]
MRFIVLRKADERTEAGEPPEPELLAAMTEYQSEMARAGVLRAGAGLKPSSAGIRIKFSRGRPTVLDGPFTETKELIAGFSVIEVESEDEAIEWLRRWPTLDGGGEVELELRPLYEVDDFGPAVTPEFRELLDQLWAGTESAT